MHCCYLNDAVLMHDAAHVLAGEDSIIFHSYDREIGGFNDRVFIQVSPTCINFNDSQLSIPVQLTLNWRWMMRG